MANQSNNKRIAKNTLLLYVRTMFIMAVSLYTSRVVLNTLGVEDYGIYNVVGGVVMMFSVISSSLSSSISRFITYELGHGDFDRLKRIFTTSVNIQIGISIVILVLAETFGVWFLNTKMNIPSGRMSAANWVLQCSLISFVINLISVPYNACIIAHEKMSAFAYISILEAVLKLAVVYMLIISPYDKLATYAVLLVVVALLIRLTYGQYCKRHFEESRYGFVYDKALMKEMTGFAGWSFFGNGAYMLNVQGVDMLINIFFGVTFNAARGVANQVQNAVMQFVNNFTVAVNPQITKSYAAGEMKYMYKLVCRGARFSYFLLLVFVVPIVCEADYILRLWLKTVPEYAPVFLRLGLFGALMTLLGNSMLTAISATGNIRKYQIWVTTVGCLVFPLTWIAFEFGAPPQATYMIYIVIYFLLNFVRLYISKGLLDFPVRLYLSDVILRVIVVSAVSFILPLLVICNLDEGFLRLCVTCIVSVVSTASVISILGLEKAERTKILNKLTTITKNKQKQEMSLRKYIKRGARFILRGVPVKNVTAEISYLQPGGRLSGKKIIVTGGGKGLGAAMAAKFVSEGASVLISGRNEKTLKATAERIGCRYLTLDMQDTSAFDRFISDADAMLDGADCLVNNAGISLHEPTFFDVTPATFDAQIATNLRGGFFLTQSFTKMLLQKQRKGNVLFVSSETGETVDIRPYGFTKAAVNSMVQGLACLFVKDGIRVNAVAPGITASDMTGYRTDGNLYLAGNATERVYLPGEVAETACFLLSDVSGCISGQVIVCNNGKTINPRWK